MVDPSRNHLRLLGQGGSTLVFGHGFGSDQGAWSRVAEAMAATHRVLLFDHVGFGRSDRLAHCDQRHSSLDGYAQDLLDILEDQDLSEVVYVGHSIGGVIGLLASLRAPRRFARLVLLNTSPHFIDEPGYRGGFQRRQIAGLLAQMDADYPATVAFLAPVAIGPDNPAHHVDAFGRGLHALDPVIATRFARLTFYVDCRARLAEVRPPVWCCRARTTPSRPSTSVNTSTGSCEAPRCSCWRTRGTARTSPIRSWSSRRSGNCWTPARPPR